MSVERPESPRLARRTEVHKFGGTSLGDAERIGSAADLVAAAAEGARLVAVASAMSGVTDDLISASEAAQRGEREAGLAIVDAVRERHRAAIAGLTDPDGAAGRATLAEVDLIVDELRDLIRGSAMLGELTLRTRDRIHAAGEKLSVRLLARALRERGVAATWLDADAFLETDDQFGRANPLPAVAERTIDAAIRPVFAAGETPVVTGYCGRAPDGATTTLGRGGSDLTATLIAASIGASEVTIWTDVDGVFSADPTVVDEARVIPQLNYREASELSYYGAKVLHQRTMIPVAGRRVPVHIRNTLAPERPGTVVDGRFTPGSHPVKAISAVRRHCLLAVEGKGMAGVPGVAARVFGSLAAQTISVTMISQSSSEASICLAVPEAQAADAEAALKREFRPDLSRGDVEEVVVRGNVGLVAVVGLGMAQTPGIASRVFTACARASINVLAIAQGSSELNISLAVDETQVAAAVRAVHEEFGLGRVDTGVESARGLDLILLGSGQIGRALVDLVLDRRAHVFRRFGLQARIVAVGDRSGFLLDPAGIGLDRLRQAIEAKASGHRLAELSGGRAAKSPQEMVEEALRYRLTRPVLVDVSDSPGSGAVWRAAFQRRCDVVTANKIPLAQELAEFRSLIGDAAENGRLLKAEATVGAGLPVLDTLEMLQHTGDTVRAAEGSLSGTLGFVMGRLEEGVRFTEAVFEAVARGYAEPDPVADLTGADVARKALILGRFSGLVGPKAAVEVEGLVDPALAGAEPDALRRKLAAYDGPLRERVEAARTKGCVLRYRARVEAERISVGPAEVPAESELGRLKGTDNLILFQTERYDARPLVVIGPGAGIEVTAMGVLGDILRIAAERG